MSSVRNEVLKYTLLPGILPRLYALFSSGFVHIAYLMAVIYHAIRLLPSNHPYLNPANRGSFGMRHVIAAASKNLIFDKKHIDQVIVFFTVLAGIALLFLQILILALMLFVERPALAQANPVDDIPYTVQNLFGVDSKFGHGGNEITRDAGGGNSQSVPSAPQDLAYIVMDRVFGVKGIFDSCVTDPAVPCFDLRGNEISGYDTFPTSFHLGLHKLLAFYSYGIFMIGVFIIIYFVATIVGEAAVSGTPFGQRMNKAWAPVRMVLFFAMLVPISVGNLSGINGAQYITLLTAKVGSNFATNGWGYFTRKLLLEADNRMIAVSEYPPYKEILEYVMLVRTCEDVEHKAVKTQVNGTGGSVNVTQGHIVEPYIVKDSISIGGSSGVTVDKIAIPYLTSNFDQAIEFTGGRDIVISVGFEDPDNKSSSEYKGNVVPQCGQFVIPIKSNSKPYLRLAEAHYNAFANMWMQSGMQMAGYISCFVARNYVGQNNPNCPEILTDQEMLLITKQAEQAYREELDIAIKDLLEGDGFAQPDDETNSTITNKSNYHNVEYMIAKGWGGAGLWYSRIAEINGDVSDGIMSIPRFNQYPLVMEVVAEAKNRSEEKVARDKKYEPALSNGQPIKFTRPDIDPAIATVLYNMEKTITSRALSKETTTGNTFIDFVNFLFGTEGIFDMKRRVQTENGEAMPHPMAQLSSLGKSMMFASMRNVVGGLGFETLSLSMEQGSPGKAFIAALGGFFLNVGLAAIAISFVLFYVIPFLPLIYFVFALSGWVKCIFEAIVAMPLWALAHLRIDGDGIPGTDAANGYYLVMEIFLRPILTIFGLLASIIIFQAMVEGLNQIFETLIGSIGGTTRTSLDEAINQPDINTISNFVRGPVDEFFYTVMYVIFVYMIGISSFKMIDAIPNQIMRWIGVNVSTFQESAGDPAGQVTQSTFTGTTMLTGKLSGGQLAAILG